LYSKYFTPLPRYQRNAKDLVSDIHCLSMLSQSNFIATLKLPPSHSAAPVLENIEDKTKCQLELTSSENTYSLKLEGDLSICGVRTCPELEGGKDWLCLLVRYPVLAGLRLPEDEVIDIKCKPKAQAQAVIGEDSFSFQENMVEQMSPALFSERGHEFISEIGLFRRLAGTHLYAARVKSGSRIELGENVQLRSIVRPGDGWNYSKLTNIIVKRVRDGKPLLSPENSIKLVHSDGCRNPSYVTLAPYKPWVDDSNSLVNNFDFRVFMFEDMESGDSIVITAQVVACVEESDCLIKCNESGDSVRRRRDLGNSVNWSKNETYGKTEKWKENLELKVTASEMPKQQVAVQDISECQIYLIVTLSTALTFCVISATIVLYACIRRWREVQADNKEKVKNNYSETLQKPEEILKSDDNNFSETVPPLQPPGQLYFVPYTYKQSIFDRGDRP